ncbi:MAG: endo-1,3-alpha-glucanase family glycosylhydrolase [Roseiflexaceae bacterium]
MFSTYLNCEITIGAFGSDSFPITVRGPGGDASGSLAALDADPAFQELIARLATPGIDADVLDKLGQQLFAALFHGPVRDVYIRSQGVLSGGHGMRLTFNIDDGTAASALHWELLYDPDQGQLALLDMPVVRYLPQQAVIPTLKTALPLKVLLTGAQTTPDDQVGRGLEAIKDVLEGPNLSPYVEITVEPHLTFAKLQKLLRQGFHVWHFVGRVATDPRSGTAQIFCEDTNQPRAINAQQLNILLNRSGVRLVILDTISDGELALDPLRRLAAAVVRAQVPAAIGAQFTAHAESAQAFTEEFYRALAEGFPIDACVTEGRKAVMSAVGLDQIDWASPVVYTRVPDGQLFDLPAASAPDVTGQIVFPAGELWRGGAVQVSSVDGVLLFPAGPPQIERLEQNPRPPRRVRGFIGRERELAEIQSELQPNGGVWLYGPNGCGMSTLLREAVNTPAAGALPDGVAYVEGGTEPPFLDDVLQRLFERFYSASPPLKVDPAAARSALSKVQALFALDSLPLKNADLGRLADTLADSAVLIAADLAGPDTLLRLRLGGLTPRDAIRLYAAVVDLAEPEADVAALLERFVDALDNMPLPLLLLGRILRHRAALGDSRVPAEHLGQALNSLTDMLTQERDPMARAVGLALLDLAPADRAALASLARISGPDAELATIAAGAGLPPAAALAALERLAEMGLVESSADRFALASLSLRRALGRALPDGHEPSQLAAFYADVVGGGKAIGRDRAAQLVALVTTRRGDLGWIERERTNLMAAIETLLAEGKPDQAGALARALEPVLVLRGLWSCWGQVIGWAEQAGRASGNQALLSWALHARGTRAGLYGDRTTARDDLGAAREIRLKLGDQTGAAASLRNLSYLRLLQAPPVVYRHRRRGGGPLRLLGLILGVLLALGTVYGASAYTGLLPAALVPDLGPLPQSLISNASRLVESIAPGLLLPTPAEPPTSVPALAAADTPSPVPTATLAPSAAPTSAPTSIPANTLIPSASPRPSAVETPSVVETPITTQTPSVLAETAAVGIPGASVEATAVEATAAVGISGASLEATAVEATAVEATALAGTAAAIPSAAPALSSLPEPSASPTLTPIPTPTLTPTPAALAAVCQDLGRAVIAFYYAWYDTVDWRSGKTSTGDLPSPTYAGGDDATLERHLSLADEAGIDAFACAWKGPGDATTTNRCKSLMTLARGHRAKVAMFADQADTRWFIGKPDVMISALQTLTNDFMGDAGYYRVNGRPVMLVWQAEQFDVATWQSIRQQVDPNHEQFWMGGTTEFDRLDVFDSLFYFDITNYYSASNHETQYMSSYIGRLAQYNQAHPGANKPFIATVQAGYDDTINRPGSTHPVEPHTRDASFYKATWQFAINKRACAVMLSTFNEFLEGAYIEPSEQFGRVYLDTTTQFAQQYKGAP